MPTTGNNTLGKDRAVWVMSLMSSFKFNFLEILADEIKIRDTKSDDTLYDSHV